MLIKPAAELCGGCHDTADPATKEKHHGADMAGLNCAGCHQPHGSEGKGLIANKQHAPFAAGECADLPRRRGSRDRSPAPRRRSAATATPIRPRPPAPGETLHKPVADGACTECHNPHAAEADSLLVLPTEGSSARSATPTSSPTRRCGTPPSRKGTAPVATPPHRSKQPGLLISPATELCGTCHAALIDRIKAGKAHGPVAQNKCQACHQPHQGTERGLLRKPLAELCATCHADQRRPAGQAPQLRPRSRRVHRACHDPARRHGAGNAAAKRNTRPTPRGTASPATARTAG